MFLSKLFKRKSTKLLTLFGALAMALGVGAAASYVASEQQNEVVETKAADATTTATFARFYFCEGSWGLSTNPRISKKSLETNFGDSVLFSNNSTPSSYSELSFPSGSYFYIDFEIANNTTLYFRFEQSGSNVYPKDSGYTGNVGSYSPGNIYTFTAGTWRGDSGNNKWCDINVSTIGHFGTFNVNGGTRNAGEDYDYKEFRNSATLAAVPTKSGSTFMGWEASTNGILNRAETSFTTSTPIVFKAIWHSNTLTTVAGNKTRVWVGYDCNGSVGSLMYNGLGTETKLWIHQGDGGKGTAEEIISATGTYYNDGENVHTSLADCPRRYDYFDVPLSYFTDQYYLNVQRFNSSGSWTNTGGQIRLSNGSDCAFKVLYVPATWENAPGFYGIAENAPDSLFASVALCGIHSCSDSLMNGYAGYDAYYATFVQQSSVASGMSSYTVNDFADGDTSYTGSTSKTISAKAKLDFVNAKASGSSDAMVVPGAKKTQDSPLTTTLWIVLASGLAGLAAIGTAYFVSKKKRHQA